ncbi:MAG: 3-hydroxyacyl-CoA dehydrogenase NAD-binding domain-containing protein [Bacteroidota bacterium]
MESVMTPPAATAAGTHKPFRTAAVLGAGTMGSQIAAHLANAGLQVYLLDVTPESIGREGKPNSIVEKAFKAATRLSPAPFMNEAAKRRVTLGNFDEHFDRVGEVDWVIEVVIEKMAIKQSVMARVEETARKDAVISTNTSGLPIGEIAEGRSDSFKSRFLGTHFFNPPRYLKLFEMIPTADTDPAVVERVAHFARVHLGKGIVVAKDTPNFIGNRIGVYGIMGAIDQFESGAFTIEEIDQLTGTLIGHPRSATFRTADVVGLDVLGHVTENLYENVPGDESREMFRSRDVLAKLVEAKLTGQKAGGGFYKKTKEGILSINPASMEYEPKKDSDLDIKAFKKAGDLKARLNALYEDEGRAGQFFRTTTLDLLAYSARRIPEIADTPKDIDNAMCWGFGWEAGPFEIWDLLGVDRVRDGMAEHGLATPDWVASVPSEGFYGEAHGIRQVWTPVAEASGDGAPGGGYVAAPTPADEISLPAIRATEGTELWKNSEAALLDMGDGVALFEFRSKANSLGQEVMGGLRDAIEKVENDPDLRGIVIANDGKNFSVGANLGEMAMAVAMGQMDQVEGYIADFQATIQRVRYAAKPVVVAPHQRVLGGGCEMTMASVQPVLAAETYIGLVELGVGLIPAGTGTMRMTAWAAEKVANRDRPSELQPFVRQAFEHIAMADVATSGKMAIEYGYVPSHTIVVMNDDRRFHVAKQQVLALSNSGYLPPAVMNSIPVLGAPGRAQFDIALFQYVDGGYISEYDRFLASRLAYVMTGGALTGPAEVHEGYLIELEREVFMSLLGEEKTQARVMHILQHNKPLRN